MPAFAAWIAVAHARGQQDQGDVGDAGDLHLGLTDPDRLDQHHVEAGGVEDPQRLRGGHRQPAEVAAGRHRPDVGAGVEGVCLHPHPVAEQRPAGERRARIDGEHAHPTPGSPETAGSASRWWSTCRPLAPRSARSRSRVRCRGASASDDLGRRGELFSTALISRPSARGRPSRAWASNRSRSATRLSLAPWRSVSDFVPGVPGLGCHRPHRDRGGRSRRCRRLLHRGAGLVVSTPRPMPSRGSSR